MSVRRLRLTDFRCFEAAEIEPGPGWNLITGANASGKTSLLEALFFLGRGKSFRTGRAARLVRDGSEGFRLVSELAGGHQLGVERTGREMRWRLDREGLRRLAEIASVFPVLTVDASAQLLVEGGPEHRRRFLDWGLFHVEPGFLESWKRYRQALSQRNRILRELAGGGRQRLSGAGGDDRNLASWNRPVAEAGEALDRLRKAQVERIDAIFGRLAEEMLGVEGIGLEYQSGWKHGETLESVLSGNIESEVRMAHTLAGPHRAELKIRLGGRDARERISRGQQKLLAASLLLAGAHVFEEVRGKGVTLLVDDLPAELDRSHAVRFGKLLSGLSGQCFVTGLEAERLAEITPQDIREETRWFHVEQGAILRR